MNSLLHLHSSTSHLDSEFDVDMGRASFLDDILSETFSSGEMHIYKMWKSALASQWTFLTPVVRVDGTSSTAELRDIEVKASSPEKKK